MLVMITFYNTSAWLSSIFVEQWKKKISNAHWHEQIPDFHIPDSVTAYSNRPSQSHTIIQHLISCHACCEFSNFHLISSCILKVYTFSVAHVSTRASRR